MMRVYPLILAMLFGCANESILELEFSYPPATSGIAFSIVEARDSSHPFTANWHPAELADRPFALTDARTTERVSVLSPDTIEQLHLKVIFCGDETCGERRDLAPQAWFTIERPFYTNEVTKWSFRFDNLPTEERTHPCPEAEQETEDPACEGADRALDWLVVDRCRVAGCTDGSSLGVFCRMGSDQHFCEP